MIASGCRRLRQPIAVALVAVALAGAGAPHAAAALRFPEDVFAFANETVWEYHTDAASGRQWWTRRDPRPPFSLRCGPMARAVRQFYVRARFEPAAPPLDEAGYERLVRAVMASDPRRPRATRIVIPGYPDLRSFSAAHGELIRRTLSGAWSSQLQRGNWRMIFPFSRGHQAATMRRLVRKLAAGEAPIVHVLRFPAITLNHMIVVYAAEESPAEVRFFAYDPNDAAQPIVLAYDRVARRFSYPRTPYFPGGPVRLYEIYDGWLY
ncbi:MAG TPA: hypothetical protein VNO26_12610 [Candidatus Limnocylindria bacterium]|nr:hypothetical protein [Candidatus Limnocylindria bacterium]